MFAANKHVLLIMEPDHPRKGPPKNALDVVRVLLPKMTDEDQEPGGLGFLM